MRTILHNLHTPNTEYGGFAGVGLTTPAQAYGYPPAFASETLGGSIIGHKSPWFRWRVDFGVTDVRGIQGNANLLQWYADYNDVLTPFMIKYPQNQGTNDLVGVNIAEEAAADADSVTVALGSLWSGTFDSLTGTTPDMAKEVQVIPDPGSMAASDWVPAATSVVFYTDDFPASIESGRIQFEQKGTWDFTVTSRTANLITLALTNGVVGSDGASTDRRGDWWVIRENIPEDGFGTTRLIKFSNHPRIYRVGPHTTSGQGNTSIRIVPNLQMALDTDVTIDSSPSGLVQMVRLIKVDNIGALQQQGRVTVQEHIA